MKWAKTVRYQSTVYAARRTYAVLCESDFDDGFAVYINGHFIADVEKLPTEEELVNIIEDNIEIEENIKSGFAGSGVFAQ